MWPKVEKSLTFIYIYIYIKVVFFYFQWIKSTQKKNNDKKI